MYTFSIAFALQSHLIRHLDTIIILLFRRMSYDRVDRTKTNAMMKTFSPKNTIFIVVIFVVASILFAFSFFVFRFPRFRYLCFYRLMYVYVGRVHGAKTKQKIPEAEVELVDCISYVLMAARCWLLAAINGIFYFCRFDCFSLQSLQYTYSLFHLLFRH